MIKSFEWIMCFMKVPFIITSDVYLSQISILTCCWLHKSVCVLDFSNLVAFYKKSKITVDTYTVWSQTHSDRILPITEVLHAHVFIWVVLCVPRITAVHTARCTAVFPGVRWGWVTGQASDTITSGLLVV